MALNSFNEKVTKRLSTGILAINGAMLFTNLNLIGSATVAGKIEYAKAISDPVGKLVLSSIFSILAFIFAEIAERPDTPAEGHPHSKRNYLESAFALLFITGMILIFIGILGSVDASTRVP